MPGAIGLAGLGLDVAGTGLEMYGNHVQNQAISQALANYRSGLNANLAAQQQEDAANRAFASAQAHQKQNALTAALNAYTAGPTSAQPQMNALHALVAKNKLTDPNETQTGANAGWQAPLDAFSATKLGNQVQLAGDQAQQQAQQLAQDKAMSGYRIIGQQLDRQSADQSGLAAIENAIREREWARQQGQFQLDMNGAQHAGASSMQLGGWLGAGGGLASALGASGGQSQMNQQNQLAIQNGQQVDPNLINTG